LGAAAGLVRPHPLAAANPEVRGTWLTTTGTDHIQSGANTPAVMADLRAIGLNTVYVESWKNGYTNYPSQTLRNLIGTTDRNPSIGTTRDLVQETLIHAHRQGLIYNSWFEYGAIAQFIGAGGSPSNPLALYMKNQGWLLQNQSGQYADSSNGGFAYMNIAVPQVRQFLVDITLEAVNRYDFDGIQFDDHMAWPINFGFDATTIGLYTSETGNPAPTSPTNSQFSAWRQQKVTAFASQLYDAVKTARPELKFSVSPSITTFSTTNYNVNWPQWVTTQNIFDEFAVQLYRDSYSSFSSIVNAQTAPFKPNELDQLVFGIKINGSTTTPFADLQQMIQRARTEGTAGHSIWYSAGVRDLYGPQLTAFYEVATNGPAANPIFPSDQRPLPTVAQSLGGGDWLVDFAAPGRYRVAAKVGSYWTEIAAVDVDAGARVFNVPGATQVELLADRRSPTSFLGDFNGDFAVDGADLLIWQQNLNSLAGAPTAGDANHDGKVNAQDLAALRFNAGRQLVDALAANSSVPEPSALCLGLMVLAGRSFRPRAWIQRKS
jgi:uncharacterized lipoprotein YddW (UPF0748 family)